MKIRTEEEKKAFWWGKVLDGTYKGFIFTYAMKLRYIKYVKSFSYSQSPVFGPSFEEWYSENEDS